MDEIPAVDTLSGGARALWPRGRYVVGVDGSDASTRALAYALRLANCTQSTVEVVFAWQSPLILRSSWAGEAEASTTAARVLADAIEVAERGMDVRPVVSTVVRQGSASAVLREVSANADLLIVGSRGRGGFAGLLLGSVSSSCAEHSKIPVLIIRGPLTDASAAPANAAVPASLEAGHYVVGVDGGRESGNVLRHAIRLAITTHSTVQVVTAWHDTGTSQPIAVPKSWSPQSDAEEILSRALESVLGDEVPDWVTALALPGRAADALVKHSSSATLLIVGSRGHGGFAGLLLGSVSAACAQYASCPVLVVHGTGAVLSDPAEREALDL